MLELEPRRFTVAVGLSLLAATALLGLGAERLARGHGLLAVGLLLAGALVAALSFSLQVQGARGSGTVLLVTRDTCPSCDEARALLRGLQDQAGLDVWEVNVDEAPALAERFGAEVPVLIHEGDVVASMEVREADIRSIVDPDDDTDPSRG